MVVNGNGFVAVYTHINKVTSKGMNIDEDSTIDVFIIWLSQIVDVRLPLSGWETRFHMLDNGLNFRFAGWTGTTIRFGTTTDRGSGVQAPLKGIIAIQVDAEFVR